MRMNTQEAVVPAYFASIGKRTPVMLCRPALKEKKH
jgi:hypothetical protein